ncbi:hypothetical protein V7266_00755 [Neobacillus drentensis]|uniref:hypothetical protein n=1 Tax=Neobacillus drentensis TaxID=220684 RepID=UPI003000FA9A
MIEKPFPLNSILSKYQKSFTESQIGDSNHKRNEYLEIIEPLIRYFFRCMNHQGRIIDPYVRRETQYSTPAFAAAAALLYRERKEKWMLEAATQALEASLNQMATETCADGHSNFYTTMVTFAYVNLKPFVSIQKIEELDRLFHRINHATLYRKTINNWKVVALAGEFLRGAYQLGHPMSLEELDQELAPQMELLTEYGLYVDPNGPMAYAMFTRNYFRLMLLEGYDGRHKAKIAECCRRGDVTSLFMQSPTGEMPTGGRSAQHQWNEAQQAFQFEVAAREYARRGEHVLAAAFKRGARLSLKSMNRWVRPTGELNVVRNYSDPMIRTGYETYTYHSQYNLLSAYFLALAFEQADDEIGELPCPAEVGGFHLWMEPYFHKLIINAGGHYIEYQTKGDEHYTPTGIVRIQRKNVWPSIGPADGTPLASARALSFAPAWINVYKDMTRMSEMTSKDLPNVEVSVHSCERDKVEVKVSYRGPLNGAFLIERTLTVTPEILHVKDTLIGEIEAVIQEFPLFASDGETCTTINLSENRIDVDYKGEKVCIRVLEEEAISDLIMGPQVVTYRNGMLTSSSYRTTQTVTQYMIHLYQDEHLIEDTSLLDMVKEGVRT